MVRLDGRALLVTVVVVAVLAVAGWWLNGWRSARAEAQAECRMLAIRHDVEEDPLVRALMAVRYEEECQ